MNAVSVIIAVLVLWSVRESVVALLVRRRCSQLRHQLRLESTQSHFAQARNGLMELSLTNRIDVNSATFKSLYYLHTLLISRPGEYPQISTVLNRTFLTDAYTHQDNQVLEESQFWSPDIKQIVMLTADGLNDIVLNYHNSQSFSTSLVYWMRKLTKRPTKSDPVFEQIYKTQKRLHEMSEAH